MNTREIINALRNTEEGIQNELRSVPSIIHALLTERRGVDDRNSLLIKIARNVISAIELSGDTPNDFIIDFFSEGEEIDGKAVRVKELTYDDIHEG